MTESKEENMGGGKLGLGADELPNPAQQKIKTETKTEKRKTSLWICGQFAFGEPGRLPWKTLRVSHRAPLCPQAPQTSIHF